MYLTEDGEKVYKIVSEILDPIIPIPIPKPKTASPIIIPTANIIFPTI